MSSPKIGNLQLDISTEYLERVFQVFYNTKKELFYNNHTGLWYWSDLDTGEGDSPDLSDSFPTALRAMEDAVDPYLYPEE